VIAPDVARAVGLALGSAIRKAAPLAGGDINQAYQLELASGASVFMKTNDRAPAEMFVTEATGLQWLREAGALRIPEVLAASSSPPFLVLELLEPGRRRADFDEALGRGLALLHRAGASGFGWEHDNFIGPLPQSNRQHASFPEFYWHERLAPQLRLAIASARATRRLREGLERLADRLPALVPDGEPPARLHGDLWGGNLHVDAGGNPCLIDPAAYGGHREIDLAMMRLFGGFGARVFEAYEEVWPLAPGADRRVALFQLYPLMVHVNLFGGSYVASVEQSLARYV
jgi:fructosamine-3-kinase